MPGEIIVDSWRQILTLLRVKVLHWDGRSFVCSRCIGFVGFYVAFFGASVLVLHNSIIIDPQLRFYCNHRLLPDRVVSFTFSRNYFLLPPVASRNPHISR